MPELRRTALAALSSDFATGHEFELMDGAIAPSPKARAEAQPHFRRLMPSPVRGSPALGFLRLRDGQKQALPGELHWPPLGKQTGSLPEQCDQDSMKPAPHLQRQQIVVDSDRPQYARAHSGVVRTRQDAFPIRGSTRRKGTVQVRYAAASARAHRSQRLGGAPPQDYSHASTWRTHLAA